MLTENIKDASRKKEIKITYKKPHSEKKTKPDE